MLKDILQGKPLRHPLHPFLIHFPIGLFVLSLLLDIAARFWPEIEGLSEGAFYSMAAGVVTALLAAVPGFVDYTGIRRDHPARKIAVAHMVLNLVVVGLYAVNLGVRKSQAATLPPSTLPLILSIIAVGLLTISGHLGGKLVFDNGISVGRHRRKTRLPERTLKLTGDPASEALDGLVRVARESELADGETLRVQLDGTVIVIARSEGALHAFQEFCTHRFGPLSEGCMKDGEIVCPWHRSRFAMSTGEVTRGPAKENLKTFQVVSRDGEIYLSTPQRAGREH